MRIFAIIVLLVSILFFPFWVSAILGIALMSYFSYFVEAIFIFLISDLIFGTSEPKFFYFQGVSFLSALIIFILIEIIKNKLRFRV